jgi:hypothetical protein
VDFFIFNLSGFSKNKWSNQNFREMYAVTYGGGLLPPYPRALSPAAVGHGGRSLVLAPRRAIAVPGLCRRAARRQARTAVSHGGSVFLVFDFLKHFNFLKTTN